MRLLGFLLALALTSTAPLAQTCTTSWTTAVDGDWSEAANWSDGVPTASDTACVTAPGTYTVSLDQDQALGGLVVGGASGTQTLSLDRSLETLGEGTIGDNGVVETQSCGTACGGLKEVVSTLIVEGTLVHREFANLLSRGGTVDIAPGGTLRVRTGINSVNMGSGTAGSRSRIIVRGTLFFDAEGQATNFVLVVGDLDLRGGTIAVTDGRIDIQSQGRWTGGTFDVPEGGYLWFLGGAGSSGVYEMSGTYSGTPAGQVQFSSGATLAAAPDGATLDVGGAGIEIFPGSGQSTAVTSAGGSFVNTGRIRVLGNGLQVKQGILRNEGRIDVSSSLLMQEGGILRNAPSGTVEFIDGSEIVDIDRTGRLINEGLVVSSGDGTTTLSAYRGRAGSEIRVLDDSRVTLLAPGSDAVPAGASVTGTGTVFVQFRNVFIEGAISPGTEEAPIGTLFWDFNTLLASGAGDARLVIDVDENGASDVLEAFETPNSVELGGTLLIRVAEGYSPQVGDTFTVIRTSTGVAGAIAGDFDVVATEGAPDDIAFVAEKTENDAELIVRAVERMGGPLIVSATEIIGGGKRRLFLTGPGAGDVTSARLECTSCFDSEEFGAFDATLSGSSSLREATFDLTSPRAYGFYDLVLERVAQPDSVIAFTVRPFMSFISLISDIDIGVGVRPVGNRYNWSQLTVSNTSNAPEAGFMIGAVAREAADKTALAVAEVSRAGATPFYVSDDAPDPEAPVLVLGRVLPSQNSRLVYGQRVAPEDVLFPEQTRTGPDDDRLPFGEALVFSGLVAHHLTLDRATGVVTDAVRSTGNGILDGYLADAEAAEPGATERAAQTALLVSTEFTGGFASLFDRVVNTLADAAPPPAGVGAAVDDFTAALDAEAGRHLEAMYLAHEVDLDQAPGDVRQLVVDEFEALGGYGESASRFARGDDSGGEASCPAGGPDGGSGSGGLLKGLLRSPADRRALGRIVGGLFPREGGPVEKITAVSGLLNSVTGGSKTPQDAAANSGGGGDNLRLGDTSGSYSLPPDPPAGPSGGGGGACGGVSAPADPNDKTVFAPQYRCEFGTVIVDGVEVPRCVRYFVPLANATDAITYTIDFENLPLATANAEFVTITDELDSTLDPSTLEVYGTSSDSTFSYTVSGQTVTFRFVGIDLPPNVTDPEGKGFVSFGVQPRAGLETGTEIRNDASIVFDFNPAIETPEVIHEIRETADLAVALAVPDVEQADQPVTFRAVVVNAQGDLATKVAATISLPIAPTNVSVDGGECTGTVTLSCTFDDLEAGDFRPIEIMLPSVPSGESEITIAATTSAFDAFAANDSETVRVQVVGVSTEDEGDALTTARLALPAPNPTRGPVTLRWGLPAAGRAHVRVFDLLGREVAEIAPEGDAAGGWHEMRWTPSVASGVYVIRLDAEVGGQPVVRTRRLVVVR